MAKEVESSFAPPIVQLSLCQDSQQRALACFHATQHCQPDVQELREVQTSVEQQLTATQHSTHLLIIGHLPNKNLSHKAFIMIRGVARN